MIANAAFAIGLSSFSQFAGPITFEKFANLKDLKKVATGLRYVRLQVWFVCVVTALAALVLYFAGDSVMELLGGAAGFANYSDLLPVITVGIGLFFIGQTLNSVGFGYDRMGMYVVPKVLGAGLMLVSYWLGARSWGVSGVAWASVVTNGIYVGLTLVANRTILREGPALWGG
jgi:O-antigen/teichoic acid export membrane protein